MISSKEVSKGREDEQPDDPNDEVDLLKVSEFFRLNWEYYLSRNTV